VPTCGASCGNIDDAGQCNGDVLRYCDGGALTCVSCAYGCGYDAANSYNDCYPAPDTGGGTPTAPTGWTCDAAYYDKNDGCDCACGVLDPDCSDPTQPVLGCGDNETCDAYGDCVYDFAGGPSGPTVPAGWTCDAGYYDMNDGCDCNCGIYDPDCDDASQALYGCGDGETCDPYGDCVYDFGGGGGGGGGGAAGCGDPCPADFPELGECGADETTLRYCSESTITCVSCAEGCGFDAASGYYDCVH
jgi:hypothetical protein